MRIDKKNEKKRIVLRPLCAFSLLPENSFLNHNSSLFISEDLSFLATRVVEDNRYYELAWVTPEEIALMNSLTIATHPNNGKIHFFPARWPLYLADDGQDLSNVDRIKDLYDFIKVQIEAQLDSGQNPNSWEELPPLFLGKPYSFNKNVRLNAEYQSYLLHKIDLADEIMIRGLSHLLKSAMLKCLSRSFIDTACLEIYVSLEATLQIILSKLRASGKVNPSNKEASDFLLEAFDEPYRLAHYYESYYEDRIKAVHPNNRFGASKFVPLYVDDLYMLYNDLLRNYEFLITGEANYYLKYYE